MCCYSMKGKEQDEVNHLSADGILLTLVVCHCYTSKKKKPNETNKKTPKLHLFLIDSTYCRVNCKAVQLTN